MNPERLAIVVLGAANDNQGALMSLAHERCEQALLEYRKHRGAKIIATGGWGAHFNTTKHPHGHYIRQYLKAKGVPEEDILECAESSNTIEDAKLCRPIVVRHGIKRLLVVTSDFHVPRAQYLFEREFPDVEITFSASHTHLPAEELQRRKTHEANALTRLKQAD